MVPTLETKVNRLLRELEFVDRLLTISWLLTRRTKLTTIRTRPRALKKTLQKKPVSMRITAT